MKLGFLIWKFPAQANTFIVNEIKEFIKSGRHDYHIYSLDEPSSYTFDIFKEDLEFIDRDKITYIKKEGLMMEKIVRLSEVPFHSKLKDSDIHSAKEIHDIEEIKHKSIANKFAFSNLAKRIHEDGVKAIYSPFGNYTSDIAMMLKVHYGIPFMFSVHAYDLFTEFNYQKQKAKTCHKALPISEYNKKYLKDLGFPSIKTTVKRINFRSESGSIVGYKSEDKYIFSASRLDPMKGYEYSIKAFSEFLKSNPDYRYYIAGRGDQEYELFLKKIIKDLSIEDKVYFLGFISNEEVISYIKGARFTILSSVELSNSDKEGIPTFFIESLSNGIPAIGSKLSGIPELLNDKVGGLSEQADIDSIVYQMKRLASLLNRKIKKRKMQKQCRMTVSRMYDNLANINILNDALDSLSVEDFFCYNNLELDPFIPIENPGLDSILLNQKPISKDKTFIYNPFNIKIWKIDNFPYKNLQDCNINKYKKLINENYSWFNYEGGCVKDLKTYFNIVKNSNNIIINNDLSFVILNHLFPNSKFILYVPENMEWVREKMIKNGWCQGDLKVIDSTVKGGEAVLELMQKCMKKIIDEDSLEIIKINDKELER